MCRIRYARVAGLVHLETVPAGADAAASALVRSGRALALAATTSAVVVLCAVALAVGACGASEPSATATPTATGDDPCRHVQPRSGAVPHGCAISHCGGPGRHLQPRSGAVPHGCAISHCGGPGRHLQPRSGAVPYGRAISHSRRPLSPRPAPLRSRPPRPRERPRPRPRRARPAPPPRRRPGRLLPSRLRRTSNKGGPPPRSPQVAAPTTSPGASTRKGRWISFPPGAPRPLAPSRQARAHAPARQRGASTRGRTANAPGASGSKPISACRRGMLTARTARSLPGVWTRSSCGDSPAMRRPPASPSSAPRPAPS